MFEFDCPRCGMILQAEEEWRGLEVSCPKCNCDLIVPTVPEVRKTGMKKWLIPAGIGAVLLAVGIVVILVFTGKSAGESIQSAPAVIPEPQSAAAKTAKVQETVSADELIRELMRAENPDIRKIADLIPSADDPMVYQTAFLRIVDDALNKASGLPGKYQIFEAAGALEWEPLNERWRQFTDVLAQDFERAVREMDVNDIRALRPMVVKALPGNRFLAESSAAEEAAALLARSDFEALRDFAAKCTYPGLKARVENELRNKGSQQVSRLLGLARQMLARGDIAGARSVLEELRKVAPDDPRVGELAGRLAQEGERSGTRPRRNVPPQGRNIPLEARINRACMHGLKHEVIALMQQGADLHKVITVIRNGSRRQLTVFMSLLEKAKTRGPVGENVKRCLAAILENGFVPNEEEKAYIRENLPELTELVSP